MLELAAEIHRQLRERPGFRFLNDPRRTLRRFDLLTALHQRGLNAFRAARPTEDLAGLRYPVFVRSERFHRGPSSPLLHSPKELYAAIGRARVKGNLRDLIVVEFCDTRAADGLTSKYSAYIVGDRLVPRCWQRGLDWVLKYKTTLFTPEQSRRELEYVRTNPHADQLEEIRRIAGVGYGRIDYGVLDGRVQTWEINLNPTPGPGRKGPDAPHPPDVAEFRDQTTAFFYGAFRDAFAQADGESAGPPAVLDIDPRLAAAARRPVRERPRSRSLLRLLAPARPALESIATPLLPWVGRLAQRSGPR
jgi:hypothetical protein